MENNIAVQSILSVFMYNAPSQLTSKGFEFLIRYMGFSARGGVHDMISYFTKEGVEAFAEALLCTEHTECPEMTEELLKEYLRPPVTLRSRGVYHAGMYMRWLACCYLEITEQSESIVELTNQSYEQNDT